MNREQLKQLEKDLWSSADGLRANSGLGPSQYATPVLGILFLRFADNQYSRYEEQIQKEHINLRNTRREKKLEDIAVEKCGFFLPPVARFDYLLKLPEEQDIVKAIKEAMEAIEKYKPELVGVLPKDSYSSFATGNDENKKIPKQLLRAFSNIPADSTNDVFGQVYEYFLGQFSLAEGQDEGAFFTPSSVVRLMVEMIEPKGGTVYDPACGSGGMFVQVANYIRAHSVASESAMVSDLYVYGQENKEYRRQLSQMNLVLNGLRGEIRGENSYYEDPFKSFGKFDYVLANPPFNVDEVSLSSVERDRRFNTYGVPRNKSKVKRSEQGKETVPNANYLWINLFATSLKPSGRAALVMANSASDARHSEADIRKVLIEQNLISGMVTLPKNMFYTVTLPATLWFFDKAKSDDRILFIDARNIFTQIDRAHREFSTSQVQNIAVINHLRKGQREKFVALVDQYFKSGVVKLHETTSHVKPIVDELSEVLDSIEGKAAIADFAKRWGQIPSLKSAFEKYQTAVETKRDIAEKNKAQIQLREKFDPFFEALHSDLKAIDKVIRKTEKVSSEQAKSNGQRLGADRQMKALKSKITELHAEMKKAEEFFTHIGWLQERFPNAEYEDVTGLCKLASMEEVKEQEYSLNAGRYVGVVIEEDGKSESEFFEDLASFKSELMDLSKQSEVLLSKIQNNIEALIRE